MRYILSVLFLVVTFTAKSQSYSYASLISDTNKLGTVNGLIVDTENTEEGLAFATISVKNTQIEVFTEVDGTFILNLKPGLYTLIIDFIGYQSLEIPNVKVVAGKITTLNKKMSPLKPGTTIMLK